MFVGNPKQVADQMEEWFTAPACDGFVLAATNMPGAYDDVVRLLEHRRIG
jgi:alkanesulfonate monooxygenase SsuD/methylene tetrahydromethanopterin reductase-like flavin-dependent oxidoreductase (luciferase family)